MQKLNNSSDGTIYVCCSCDKNYAMPLAVMLISLFEHVDHSRKTIVYILDGGIKNSDRCKIIKSLGSETANIKFIKIDNKNLLDGVVVNGHISIATYFRLLIPSLLPKNIKKVIYLDSDIIVNADIGKLWDINIKDNYILAAQEQSKDAQLVSSPDGLINYKELGLNPNKKYFNDGVLVINLEKWRKNKTGNNVINYVLKNKKYIRFWDQDGLNAILSDKWGELDPRWNLVSQIFNNPEWYDGPIKDRIKYEELIKSPYIIHFNTNIKPWQFNCIHPYKNLFIKYLSKTPYRTWRIKMYLYKIGEITKTSFLIQKIKNYPELIGSLGQKMKRRYPKLYKKIKPYFPDR